ncbi:hypothetical protein Bca52824_017684 [Brassica carinata]|uniref:Uncharacterized protein n=1 Tax=Brassica carinata TaxID=52824 RepID=A0A8X8AYK7_BRACI|nr:hypothetical protein Bca52824_017684 [Brassica carinata]
MGKGSSEEEGKSPENNDNLSNILGEEQTLQLPSPQQKSVNSPALAKPLPGSEEASPASFGNAKEKEQAKKDGKRVVADKGVADGAHKQAKRDGKRTAVGDNVTDVANKQAPPKRAKAARNSGVGALVVENQQQR